MFLVSLGAYSFSIIPSPKSVRNFLSFRTLTYFSISSKLISFLFLRKDWLIILEYFSKSFVINKDACFLKYRATAPEPENPSTISNLSLPKSCFTI